MLEAFTPTRGASTAAGPFVSVPSVSEGGVIPASCYFFQDSMTQSQARQGVSTLHCLLVF